MAAILPLFLAGGLTGANKQSSISCCNLFDMEMTSAILLCFANGFRRKWNKAGFYLSSLLGGSLGRV